MGGVYVAFKIGNIEIKNKIVLAPMAGISNPAYIRICEEMGLGLAFTELMSAEAIVRNNKKTFDMLKGIDKINIPVGIQLFGSNVQTLAKASKMITEMYPNCFIDINMGCPVPKVAVRAQAGAALLKNPSKIYEMVKEVVNSVDVPVTVKIRSGWDEKSINAVEVAKAIEKAGASAITVHGRTRSQGYSGKANYDIIKLVKDNVNIPVIGNGDVVGIESAKKMFDTGVDAIMIGRGTLGNPWLIKELVSYFDNGFIIDKPSYEDKVLMCFKHLDYLLEDKPEKVAVLEMRSHIAWYLKGMPDAVRVKNLIFKAKSSDELREILNNYLEEIRLF